MFSKECHSIINILSLFCHSTSNTSNEKTVLIMENLFCNRAITEKFDLKGSLRNRLVDPIRQSGEIVLMDENLMQSNTANSSSYCNVLICFTFSVMDKPVIYINSQQNRLEASNRKRCFIFREESSDGLFSVGWIGQQRTIARCWNNW